jgi:hypothetical protein
MENVGYILMDRSRVLDGEGNEEEVLSVSIRGIRFGIRVTEMEALLEGGGPARVERLRRNWRFYLDGVEGVADLSRSGKAVNLELYSSRGLEPSGLRSLGLNSSRSLEPSGLRSLGLNSSRSLEPSGLRSIELSASEFYTIAIRALRSVLSHESRYAMVAGVPGERGRAAPRRGTTTYQLRIPVSASS